MQSERHTEAIRAGWPAPLGLLAAGVSGVLAGWLGGRVDLDAPLLLAAVGGLLASGAVLAWCAGQTRAEIGRAHV